MNVVEKLRMSVDIVDGAPFYGGPALY